MSILHCQTIHKRYSPVPLAFQYPLFYFCVPLFPQGGPSLAHEKMYGESWSLFSISPTDYVDNSQGSIYEKLSRYLNKSGIVLQDCHRPHLITLPRVFGYHFNPLSVYFILNTSTNQVDWWVMEVNNTFGERHLYILTDAVQTGSNQWKVPRTFHVSPFNPTSGYYIFQINSPLQKSLKIDINITYVENVKEKDVKVFWARLWSTSSEPITTSSLLKTFATYPLTAFKTVPRILYQANRLHNKGLLVFDKPNPDIQWKENQGTIVVNDMSPWEEFCWEKVKPCLQGQGNLPLEISSVDYELNQRPFFQTKIQGVGQGVKVRLNNYQLFSTMVMQPKAPVEISHPLLWPMMVSFIRGDYDVEWQGQGDDVEGLFCFWTALLQPSHEKSSTIVSFTESRLRSFFSSYPISVANGWMDLFKLGKGFVWESIGWSSLETMGTQWVWDPYAIDKRIVGYWNDGKPIETGGKEERRERARLHICRQVLKRLG